MKKLLLASLAVLAMSSQAATTASSTAFSVTASVTSSCVAGVAPTSPTVAFAAYPAFSAIARLSTSGFSVNVDCTRSLTAAPTAAFDTTNGLATGEGIVAGLNYSLTASAATLTSGAEPTPTTGAHNGTPDNYEFTVSGSLPAGQAGSASASGTSSRSLIISF